MRILLYDNEDSKGIYEQVFEANDYHLFKDPFLVLDYFKKSLQDYDYFKFTILTKNMSQKIELALLIHTIRTFEELKKLSQCSKTKILVATDNVDRNEIEEYYKFGCNSILLKPFTREVLSQKIFMM
jgi:DNA-binding NarL/FixJ family response regulator